MMGQEFEQQFFSRDVRSNAGGATIPKAENQNPKNFLVVYSDGIRISILVLKM